MEPVGNPLLSKEIGLIRNWHEWLKKFEATSCYEDLIGLIDKGFNIPLDHVHGEPEYRLADRFVFYLSLADGWENKSYLSTEEDRECLFGYDQNGNYVFKRISELRRMLATKAFEALCQNFFEKDPIPNNYRREFKFFWERDMVESEKLFTAVVQFFRVEEYYDRLMVVNLPNFFKEFSCNKKMVIDFLINLARFIWNWKEDLTLHCSAEKKSIIEKNNLKTKTMLDGAKLWMVEVLCVLDQFDLLKELELDGACLAKIKAIAMRSRLKKHKGCHVLDRQVLTLEEACLVGSKTAWFLMEYELVTRENERLQKILDAEIKKLEADEEIKRLT